MSAACADPAGSIGGPNKWALSMGLPFFVFKSILEAGI
jgi:hypothetical protein